MHGRGGERRVRCRQLAERRGDRCLQAIALRGGDRAGVAGECDVVAQRREVGVGGCEGRLFLPYVRPGRHVRPHRGHQHGEPEGHAGNTQPAAAPRARLTH